MSDASVFRTRPILVVEDSDDDFDTVVEAARRGQVRNRLVQARSADEARVVLAAHAANPFAFVLLDCSLPGEDGLSLLQELRAGPTNALLPVVVFTASVNPRDRDAFYAAGANAYHVKKVGFEDCLATLQQIFRYWLSDAVLPDPAALVSQPGRTP
jgi:two-component system, chemotaxis family, chemotaxis protein CheY